MAANPQDSPAPAHREGGGAAPRGHTGRLSDRQRAAVVATAQTALSGVPSSLTRRLCVAVVAWQLDCQLGPRVRGDR